MVPSMYNNQSATDESSKAARKHFLEPNFKAFPEYSFTTSSRNETFHIKSLNFTAPGVSKSVSNSTVCMFDL